MAATCDEGIPQFFAGKHVFVTGGTGFMGKVLVERLLWTCPDVSRVFLLVRNKGQHPDQRLQDLKASQAFHNLRESRPGQLDKLSLVPGDITLPRLGLSDHHIHQLTEVSVVFHSAATVKLNNPLKLAIDQNVLSVIRLLEICDRLPKMQVFVHVSTAYCNPELTTVEERVYPQTVPLRHLLDLAAKNSPELDDEISLLNTYGFTKAMAECAVQQHGCRAYPIAIFRPTIVVASLKHPYPGWLENANGPSGVIHGCGSGCLRVFKCRDSAQADLLPVDIAIDTLLAVAWETAIDRPPTPRVYNCSVVENPTTWADMQRALNLHTRTQPQAGTIWYPSLTTVENELIYKILVTVMQTIPLYLGEFIFHLIGYKKCLIKVRKRQQAMQKALGYFALREWSFRTENVQKLRRRLSEADRSVYNLDPNSIVWDEHYSNFVRGVRLYLLKEKEEDQPAAKRRLKRLYYIHSCLSIVLPVLLFHFFFRRIYRGYISEITYFLFAILVSICFRAMLNFSSIYQDIRVHSVGIHKRERNF